MLNKEIDFFDELRGILKTYKNGDEEPLDGDEVAELAFKLKTQLNYIEGNLTEEDYNRLMGK
jgi:hypothetical protein